MLIMVIVIKIIVSVVNSTSNIFIKQKLRAGKSVTEVSSNSKVVKLERNPSISSII